MSQTLQKLPIARRAPQQVMRLARLGCFHQTRLSFMRALLRDLSQADWQFSRQRWTLDARGRGLALYTARGPQHTYSLVCFAHDLPAAKRSDRVIADQWDATFALYDGIPNAAELTRLRANVPKQEAGECRQTELVLARANRSVRLFEHVVERLANGLQPEAAKIDATGYLMRTSAVYGNGKFGLSDRQRICERAEFKAAFRAELLAVWLIRWFSIDIAEHIARVRQPARAIAMSAALKRRLGVGNATGLGMAPFLILHPALLHSWIYARETALLRVRQLPYASADTVAEFQQLLPRMQSGLDTWQTTDPRQRARIDALKTDLQRLVQRVQGAALRAEFAWHHLIHWSENTLSMEAQELLVSLVLEPHGALIDDLAEQMAIDESPYFPLRAQTSVAALRQHIERDYRWATQLDYGQEHHCARFWYVSAEKLEPRLGQRFTESGADKEQPLAFARDIKALWQDLQTWPAAATLAEFLLKHPQHRHAVRRVQLTAQLEYAEIRDNLIAADMLPLDLLRCKLSFFGANRFDPRSDRWIRITMYQHAPLPEELTPHNADDWIYPPLAT